MLTPEAASAPIPAPDAAAGSAPSFAGAVEPAWLLVRTGSLRAAAVELHRLGRTPQDLTAAQRALALLLQVDVTLATGEVHVAAGLLDQLPATGPARLARAHAHGEVAAAYGDHGQALDHFSTSGTLPGAEEDLLRPWRVGATLALVRTGRRREAAAMARDQVDRAQQGGDAFALAHGLRALATAEPGRDPVGMLRRAHLLAIACGSRRLQTQLETDIAALTLLGHGGWGADTTVMLRRAEHYAIEEGLWPLHARIAALLGRMGESARRMQHTAAGTLTSAERRVARLATTGLTNREIGAELGVSVKAVEWHLSRVYRKLGIASRGQLGGLLEVDASAV